MRQVLYVSAQFGSSVCGDLASLTRGAWTWEGSWAEMPAEALGRSYRETGGRREVMLPGPEPLQLIVPGAAGPRCCSFLFIS